MKANHIVLICILILLMAGCKNNNVKTGAHTEDTTAAQGILFNVDKFQYKSFVVSCGSGCAMGYSAENIVQNGSSINVKFKVVMFINEIEEEADYVNFIFIYNNKNKLQKVESEGDNENILETLIPAAQFSFKKFGDDLIYYINNYNPEGGIFRTKIFDKK